MFTEKYNILVEKDHVNDILLVLYGLLIVINVISRSTLPIDDMAIKLAWLLSGMLFIISILIVKHTKLEYTWLLIGGFIGIENYCKTGQFDFLLIILVMFALSEVDIKKFLYVLLFTTISCLIVLMFLSKIGIISNLIFYRGFQERNSFGTHYPLVLSGYIFECCAAAAILYGKKQPYLLSIIFILVIMWMDKFVNSRNDELCILLLIAAIFINKVSIRFLKLISYFLLGLSSFLIIFSVFISKLMPYFSKSFSVLNDLLNNRLQLQYDLFNYYRPTLFGSVVPQTAMGDLVYGSNYFYIDNSFCRYLFLGGILLFIFIIFTFFRSIFKSIRYKLYIIGLVELIICINGMVADPLAVLSGGLILPIFFINMYTRNVKFSRE